MKQAGKFKFFGFSTHTNMEDCLLGAAKLGWIDAVMFTYNFQVMNTPKMQEAIKAASGRDRPGVHEDARPAGRGSMRSPARPSWKWSTVS